MKETLEGSLLRDCARLRTLLMDRIQLMRYKEAELRRLEAVAPVDLETADDGDFGCTEAPPGGESVTKTVESALMAGGAVVEQLHLPQM